MSIAQKQSANRVGSLITGDFSASFVDYWICQAEHMELVCSEFCVGEKLTHELFKWIAHIDGNFANSFTAGNIVQVIFHCLHCFAIHNFSNALAIVIHD